ncbi:hypothetical protein PHG31p67 [Aeromonas phage 31]|uniref:Uncharacterized protein PHG31ORF068c n=1 Tax=Aeromonas phage 31 TaxID=321023 RepID=Q56EU4_9CAUD|nr:hypothetical protein PHG31p67 [Aeromonas phage 31]AAX63556.1 hypothetical protein PHG31p67 [Aeromonas phage 31]
MNMDINDYAKEFTREIGRNIHVNLLSTDPEQVKSTIFWTFPGITEVRIGSSTYFAQNGKIYNATIDYNARRVIMAGEANAEINTEIYTV